MGFLSKLLRLLIKVTKVTTGHQKLPKMGQNRIISCFFFARRANNALVEGQSPPQELDVGLRSGPYLLVSINESLSILQKTHGEEKTVAVIVNYSLALQVRNGLLVA